MSKKPLDLIAIATDETKHQPKPGLNAFTHVRGYHCCRAEDPQSYRKMGILLGRRDILESRFRRLFDDLAPQFLDTAIAKSTSTTSPEVDLALDYRWLFEYCPHYALFFGGERILGFAAELDTGDGIDHRERLKAIGTPSIIIVDIPIDLVTPPDREAIDKVVEALANGQYNMAFDADEMFDLTVSFGHGVPPGWIVDIKPLNVDGGRLELLD